jgi:hypothetical protein
MRLLLCTLLLLLGCGRAHAEKTPIDGLIGYAYQFAPDTARHLVYIASQSEQKVFRLNTQTSALTTIASGIKVQGLVFLDLAATSRPLHGLFTAYGSCVTFIDLRAVAFGDRTVVAGRCTSSGDAPGLGDVARFKTLFNLAIVTPPDTLIPRVFIADTLNSCIREGTVVWTATSPVSTMKLEVTTVAGICGSSGSQNGAVNTATLTSPTSVAITSTGGTLFVGTDAAAGIRTVTSMKPGNAATRTVDTLALLPGTGVVGTSGYQAFSISVHPSYSADDNYLLFIGGLSDTVVWAVRGLGGTAEFSHVVSTSPQLTLAASVLPNNTLVYGERLSSGTSCYLFKSETLVPRILPATKSISHSGSTSVGLKATASATIAPPETTTDAPTTAVPAATTTGAPTSTAAPSSTSAAPMDPTVAPLDPTVAPTAAPLPRTTTASFPAWTTAAPPPNSTVPPSTTRPPTTAVPTTTNVPTTPTPTPPPSTGIPPPPPPIIVTRTVTLEAPPPPPADDVVISKPIAILTMATGIGAPMAAMSLMRLSTVAMKRECDTPRDAPLEIMTSPFGAAIPDESVDGAFLVGAVVCNVCFILAVAAVAACVSPLIPASKLITDMTEEVMLMAPLATRITRRLATTRGSQLVVCVILVLGQPTLKVSLILLGHKVSTPGERVLGIVVVLAIVAAALAPLRLLRPSVFVSTYEMDEDAILEDATATVTADGEGSLVSKQNLMRAFRWVVFAEGDWCNTEEGSFFTQLYGPLFWDFFPASRYFMVVEVFASLAFGASDALHEAAGCMAGGICALAAGVLYMVMLVFFRPYVRRLDSAIAYLMAVSLIAVAICNVSYHATGYGDTPRDIGAVLVSIVEIVAAIVAIYQACATAVKLHKTETTRTVTAAPEGGVVTAADAGLRQALLFSRADDRDDIARHRDDERDGDRADDEQEMVPLVPDVAAGGSTEKHFDNRSDDSLPPPPSDSDDDVDDTDL